jgi:hypothetical protein
MTCPWCKRKDCRPARPRCRYNRALKKGYQLCDCGAYHFPHCLGGGACGNSKKLWERMTGILWDGEEED